MMIFGYGSLMNEDSLKRTFNIFKVQDVAELKGYSRIFNFKSPYRHNTETDCYSSVLNLRHENKTVIQGLIIDIPKEEIDTLMDRERGYEIQEIQLMNGERVSTFIANKFTPYYYVESDSVQREYLDLCLSACKKYGDDMFNNFINTTYVKEDYSVKNYLGL